MISSVQNIDGMDNIYCPHNNKKIQINSQKKRRSQRNVFNRMASNPSK